MFHIVMAACWFALGGVLLTRQWLDPVVPSGMRFGWFAMAMALYNLLRWWLGRFSGKVARPGTHGSPLRRVVDSEHSKPAPRHDVDFDVNTDPRLPR